VTATGSASAVLFEDGEFTVGQGTVACAGDCNGDGAVAINELVSAVNVSAGSLPVSACAAADRNRNGQVTIDELIAAVNAASGGCPDT
jgi:hypothetical protein